MSKFIPLSVPNLKGNELAYVTKAVEDEWVSTGGTFIDQFESSIAEYVHSAGAVACQSGTAGLHLALMAAGVDAGQEVIVPALTFIAAVNPVKYIGADPVFMDCDDSLCMDMEKVEEFCQLQCSFSDGKLIDNLTDKQIKAILIVHVFGNIANIEKAFELAERYNLVLVEDATEALGSYIKSGKFKEKFAGTIGYAGVYSFNGNKIMTTGGGGMIVSDNEEFLAKAKYLSTQAKDDPLYYRHDHIGYNYRMTNLQAALGLAQLEQLEHFITVKNDNYTYYQEQGIKLLPFRKDIRTNAWFYSFMTEKRDDLIRYLSEHKIQSRPVWDLICSLRPYEHCRSYKIEKACYYWERIVNIPCSTNLEKEDIDLVVRAIKEFGQ
ncbi:MAG: LegC family aminotransferase [Clostridia bacterium]